MRNDLMMSPWEIRHIGTDPYDDFLESVFFLGNGRMGIRGYLPFVCRERPIKAGLYVAGIFGEIRPGITDIVNLPTPVFTEILIDGAPACLCSEIERVLDLRAATLTLRYRLAANGKTADVTYQRFFPKEKPGLCLQRTVLRVDQAMTLQIRSGILTASCNCPVPDDQTKENGETVLLSTLKEVKSEHAGFSSTFDICGTGLWVEETCRFSRSAEQTVQENDCVYQSFAATLSTNGEFALDQLCCVRTSRDIDPRIAQIPEKWEYDTLLSEHRDAWQKTWDRCDLPMADDDLQCAIRYAIFQLICNCSAEDPTVSIGARGLTHGRYKGCYFWDVDLFMLPFFLATAQDAARNLCMYRVNALPAAKIHAQKMNAAGARYPWMAALDGSEQCETWDIGCSEVHITADVAYALDQYCVATGDEMFYLDYAAEVYIETARFWRSRYTYHAETDTADLLFCKGPDEYCGITSNNLFTNVMVQHNLTLACKAAADLREKRPEIYARLNVTEEEINAWAHLLEIIPWPRDPRTGRLTQDSTFHQLEPVDISYLKPTDEASYHGICFDRLQRYKVIKQADVVLLMTRFPDLFTLEEKRAAWEDFEPLCLHDSTLSFASHALFAIQNGMGAAAETYLRKALLLDLKDIMGNTGKEGLHLACMGEAWQAASATRCKSSYHMREHEVIVH